MSEAFLAGLDKRIKPIPTGRHFDEVFHALDSMPLTPTHATLLWTPPDGRAEPRAQGLRLEAIKYRPAP